MPQGSIVFNGILDFGAGFLIARPVAGDLNTNPTPRQIGALQEAQVEFSSDLVEAYAQGKYALDVATGKSKITLKAKALAYNAYALSDLFLGVDPVVGSTRYLVGPYAEASSIPATPGPYTVTVVHAANFDHDYGVTKADGTEFTKLATGTPAAGQYTVVESTGVYTFAAADQGTPVLINYSWKDAANGVSITAPNQFMGSGPRIEVILFNQYKSKQLAIKLPQVILSKWSLPRKLAAHSVSDIEGQAFTDTLGNAYYLYQDTHD